ncbi:hypothetical protein [Salmonella enterica]|uniref:hypothetical protein n=1 Tax=Salmonella enterica TaxID=28901 RepID=UPI001158A781|nr:hypothetical protein [Salmonella enterica]MBZ4903171.1 hypothetical protein [Salmonella enterica subsp. enterica serovar Typhimurium]
MESEIPEIDTLPSPLNTKPLYFPFAWVASGVAAAKAANGPDLFADESALIVTFDPLSTSNANETKLYPLVKLIAPDGDAPPPPVGPVMALPSSIALIFKSPFFTKTCETDGVNILAGEKEMAEYEPHALISAPPSNVKFTPSRTNATGGLYNLVCEVCLALIMVPAPDLKRRAP